MTTWRYKISLVVLKKIFHSFAVLTREIFFNTRREISYHDSARRCNILYQELLPLYIRELKNHDDDSVDDDRK